MSGRLRIPGVRALLAQSKKTLSGPGCLRLRLMTACLAVLVLTLGPVLVLDCLSYAADLLDGLAADILLWAVDVLMPAVILLVGMPMAAAAYRIAVMDALSAAPDGSGAEDNVPAYASGWEAVSDALRDCLHPFSSPRAYWRCLRAGLGWLLRIAELILLPLLCILAFTYDWWSLLPLIPVVLTAVKVVSVLAVMAVTVLLLIFSGSPAVYAFSVLAPAAGVRVPMTRVLWGRAGTHRTLFVLRLRMTVWVILSAAAVFVPLFLITFPVCLNVSARFSLACLSEQAEA